MEVTAEAEAKQISGASEFLPGVRKILISVALCDIAKTDVVILWQRNDCMVR